MYSSTSSTVALLTDFGQQDVFVASMKGQILKHLPTAQLLDLTHEIPEYQVLWGAIQLRAALPYMPKNTVFLGVVDPGVGSARQAVAVECAGFRFVGPDNGLFSLALQELNAPHRTVRLNPDLLQDNLPPSQTFHGRDLFAPAAARLAGGSPLEEVGEETMLEVSLELPKVQEKENEIQAKILGFDRYGNALTNLPAAYNCQQAFFRQARLPRVNCFAETLGKAATLVGSMGFYEIAIGEGNFKESFLAKVGEKITFHLKSEAYAPQQGQAQLEL